MYSILLPTGEWLDGVPDLGFELQNTVFSGSDSSVLPGSFSFPAELPTTGKNLRLLNFAGLVNHAKNPIKLTGVWVYVDGAPFFYGDLTVRGATEQKITVNIVANFLGTIKDGNLNELDFGGTRSLGANSAAARLTAKDTFQNPANYDFIFLPVYNPDFLETPGTTLQSKYTNFYDPATASFYEGVDSLAATPFPKLTYLLSRVFASTDFAFDNRFQPQLSELANLIFWNNRSIYTTANAWGIDFDLKNHVAKIGVKDFLRQVASVFNLGLFSNVFSKTVRLISLVELIRRPTGHDWTPFALDGVQIDFEETGAPDGFSFKTADDAVDKIYLDRRDSGLAAKGHVLGEYEFLGDLQSASPTPTPGHYYVHDRAGYYYHTGIFNEVYFGWQELGAQPSTYTRGQRVTGDVFQPELLPVWDAIRLSHEVPGSSSPYPQTPYVRKPGIVTWTDTGEEKKQEGDVEMRLLFYRSTYPGVSGGNYPLGAGIRYLEGGAGAQVFNNSLRWDGPYGLYAKFWQPWHEMLKNGKHVSLSLLLPVAELVQFSFEDKIRVAGMDYFVKKLRVGKPVGKGKVAVAASLISVI